jgi:putative salt-induced outer membrane protein
MKFVSILILPVITAMSLVANAQVTAPAPINPPPPFAGEAEAGAIMVTGNAKSENYAAKAKASYQHEKNIYTLNGQYIRTEANDVESTRNWNAGVRYDRELTDYFGLFASQKMESDVYAGYIQRDSTDLGVKYWITKGDSFNWSSEAGYRYSKTQNVGTGSTYDQLVRLYTEINAAIDKEFSLKYWVEYLPNTTNPDAYQVNTEASINVMLNSTFSLKVAYLLQYQNEPAPPGEYNTTTTTLNLVAKF